MIVSSTLAGAFAGCRRGLMLIVSDGRLTVGNDAITCHAVQLKHAGRATNEFADLVVDAHHDWRRGSVSPADGERVARQPQIE